MLRLTFLALIVLHLASCGRAPKDHAGTDERPPNIIFLITDDQGYGDLGAHGNPWIKTPHLDQLHDESVRFTNFHVATTCAPSRAGILSGINCNRAGAWHTVNGRSFLSVRYRTLPDELREAGYTTGLFGKWHLGDNYPYRPRDRGFDEVLTHGGGGVGQTPDAWNNDYFDDTYRHNGTPKKYEGYCTDVWFNEATDWMDEAAASGTPFFTYISTNAPHSPYHVADEYADPYRGNDSIVSPEFYGMITNIDDNLGRLRAWLREKGLDDNTLIVFTTDNGTAAGANIDKDLHVIRGYNAGMRGKKVDEYEGGHRVPLFMRFPPRQEIAPSASDQLVTYTDLLPTLVELAGGTLNHDYALDGESFLGLATGTDARPAEDRIVIVDTQRGDLPVKGKRSCAMREDWRLMNAVELYNLADDPGQENNVIDENKNVAEALQAGYDTWWASMEEDLLRTNTIVIGHPADNPVLLTCHDWHIDVDPPWHQRHIRAGLIRNGYWSLHAKEAGTYRLKLYRWPPEIDVALNGTVPALPPVPGGDGLPAGVMLDIRSAACAIAGATQTAPVDATQSFAELTVELPAGDHKLTTTFTLGDGTEVGAYYVGVERLAK